MSVAGIIFLAKLHAYRAAVARGETEQAAVRFAAEAEYAEDKRLEDRLALYPDLVKALREISLGEGGFSLDHLTHAENTITDMKRVALKALAQAEDIEKEAKG